MGIEVARNSNNNTVTDNTVIGNINSGIEVHFSSHNVTLARNVVIANLQGGISIGDSSYNKVYQNSLIDNPNNGMAIGIVSDHNIVFNNMFSKNGLSICSSNYNLIEGNSFDHDEACGMDVTIGSSNNIIVNNVVYWLGVHEGSKDNIIVGNRIEGSQLWIWNDANDNIVSNNYIAEMVVLYSSGNLIYHNNIDRGAQDTSPTDNFWHHPTLLEGNYWSGYTGVDDGSGTGKHAIAGDGIGDTDIPWPQEGYDYYPFTVSFDWKLHTVLTRALIETIKTWNLPKGTENSLTSQLNNALHLLNIGNEKAAIRMLMAFMKQVEVLRKTNKLTNDQANIPTIEAQAIIDAILE